jgi:hypothetical protein
VAAQGNGDWAGKARQLGTGRAAPSVAAAYKRFSRRRTRKRPGAAAAEPGDGGGGGGDDDDDADGSPHAGGGSPGPQAADEEEEEYVVEVALDKAWRLPDSVSEQQFAALDDAYMAANGHRYSKAAGVPGSVPEYLVKWQGYDDPAENSWEPTTNFAGADMPEEGDRIIRDFERAHPLVADVSRMREPRPIPVLQFSCPQPPLPSFEYIVAHEVVGAAAAWAPAADRLLRDHTHVKALQHALDGKGAAYAYGGSGRISWARDVIYETPAGACHSTEASANRVVTGNQLPRLEIFHTVSVRTMPSHRTVSRCCSPAAPAAPPPPARACVRLRSRWRRSPTIAGSCPPPPAVLCFVVALSIFTGVATPSMTINGSQWVQIPRHGDLITPSHAPQGDAAKGYGVWCSEVLEEGAFVCRYIGEVLAVDEAEARPDASYQLELQIKNLPDSTSTVKWPEAQFVVDAKRKGNVGRFLNHSRSRFNVFPQLVFTEGHHDPAMPTVAFFTSQRIEPFTELLFDYGKVWWPVPSSYSNARWLNRASVPVCRPRLRQQWTQAASSPGRQPGGPPSGTVTHHRHMKCILT